MSWEPYNDIQIYTYYIGEIPILGKLYKSPLRDDGERPSFSFKRINNTVYWSDFGRINLRPDIKRNGIGLVMQKENLNIRQAEGFILNTIIPSLANNTYSINDIPIQNQEKLNTETLEIRKTWRNFEYDYWKGLDFSLIQNRGIYPLHKYQAAGKKSFITSTPKSPAFVYIIDNQYRSFKIYRPLDAYIHNKWLSKRIGKVIEGYSQLPKTTIENLIITSSTKDGITVMSAIDNCWSINPTSEVVWKNILSKARELNSRARNIYVWLDADSTGHDMTKEICAKTGWEPILLDRRYKQLGMKDQFDIFKKGSLGLVNHLFRQYEKI